MKPCRIAAMQMRVGHRATAANLARHAEQTGIGRLPRLIRNLQAPEGCRESDGAGEPCRPE